jgi:hypothetical protein
MPVIFPAEGSDVSGSARTFTYSAETTTSIRGIWLLHLRFSQQHQVLSASVRGAWEDTTVHIQKCALLSPRGPHTLPYIEIRLLQRVIKIKKNCSTANLHCGQYKQGNTGRRKGRHEFVYTNWVILTHCRCLSSRPLPCPEFVAKNRRLQIRMARNCVVGWGSQMR